jgi:septal ring factor EnvC (AmiA/AmiB activator)
MAKRPFFLYDDDFITQQDLQDRLSDLENSLCHKMNELRDRFFIKITSLEEENKIFKKRIHSLENIIEPDETDVYNINRRLELLAQKIANLESKQNKRWQRMSSKPDVIVLFVIAAIIILGRIAFLWLGIS